MARHRLSFLGIASALSAFVLPASLAHAAEPVCQAIVASRTGIQIDRASAATAEERKLGAEILPQHCIVRGVIGQRVLEGKKYGIGFELRLPVEWKRRFLFQGGGGMNGSVRPAIGAIRSARSALARGYAVVSTDGGHEGEGSDFAVDPQAWLDFANASVPQVTRLAKALTESHYGQSIRYSYFMGCSNGGREAMMAAQRDPFEFDGVLAGNPGFNMPFAALEQVWQTAKLTEAAPTNAQGERILSRAVDDRDLRLITEGLLRQCDGADGLKDGLIFNVRCRFDVATLQCAPGATADGTCLDAKVVALMRTVQGGAHTSDGKRLHADWPYDVGIGSKSYRDRRLGTSDNAIPNSASSQGGVSAFYRYFLRMPVPAATPGSDEVAALAPALDVADREASADKADMTAFVARGGKLLLYTGMSDFTFSPNDLIAWRERALKQTRAGGKKWNELFLVPAMGHCGGGAAPDQFDALTPLEAWVEHGVAPKFIEATGAAFSGTKMPLCPYPSYARYVGGVGENRRFRCTRTAAD